MSFDIYVSNLINGNTISKNDAMRYELNRLLTFRMWFSASPVSPLLLARNGFYSAENGDETTCFSCGATKRNWKKGDIPSVEHRKLNQNCKQSIGHDTNEVKFHTPNMEEVANLKRIFKKPTEDTTIAEANGNRLLFSEYRQSVIELLSIEENLLKSNSTNVENTSGNTQGASAHTISNPITEYRALYRFERRRFSSYEGWPSTSPVHPRELARAGFFYTGNDDRVQCAFCLGILRRWEAGDNPLEEHKKNFPDCDLIHNRDVGNVPISMQEHTVQDSLSDPSLGVIVDKPKHQRYAVESDRMTSFNIWPIVNKKSPHDLAKAGFFYAGFGDNVKCFYCDIGLRNWEAADDPWTEHARWKPECSFVKQCRGDDFIRRVVNDEPTITDKPENPHSDATIPSTEPSNVLRENRALREQHLCKVCLDENVSMVFLPCGHLVCCYLCAASVSKCPICRVYIQGRVRAYIV